jgi:uncharacterized protein YndB with AHSA1/START domain
MPTKTSKTQSPRLSDTAVKAKTGKDWNTWFALLDKARANKMSHQEITHLLSTRHAVGPWWTQMVAVTYEQIRGLREKHQKPDGYEIGVSRTISSSAARVFKSFADETRRALWLRDNGLVVRRSIPNKSLRATWSDGKTSLAIALSETAKNRTQVVVQHSKLPDAKAASRMKTYWSTALNRLRDTLES